MDPGPLRMVADKFHWVFAEPLLHACGKDVHLCRRQRLLTPFRLGLALTATCASQRVETIAALPGGFQALLGTTITDKAFYNHVATPHFADCARTMTERLMRERTLKVLGVEKGRALSALRPRVVQDASSCAIHDGLRAVVPGRCKTVKPAAVALHTTRDLRGDAPTTVGVPPDTTHAPTFWPAPASLRDRGRWAERGYGDLHSWRHVQEAGGVLLIRAQAGMNPQVREAFRADGQRLRSLRKKPLQPIHATLPKRQRVARVVQWHVDGGPLGLRLICSWNRRTKRGCSFLTPLPSPRYPLEGSGRAYQWRGPVELRWKAWQSYANVHAFDTANPPLVAGGIGTAMAAAARTRFLAHMPHLLAEVPMSTRKVAMGAMHVVGTLVEA